MKTRMLMIAAGSLLAMSACTSTGSDGSMESSSESMASAEGGAGVMVGGAEMLPTNNIVQNASLSQDHKTLVAAVKAAGLAETLSGPGPFTVFAPTDEAFGRLGGVVNQLMQPAMKTQLQDILKYHVVSGDMSSEQLVSQIEAGGGTAMLTTLQGAQLTAKLVNGNVALTDARGNTVYVETADAKASNGVVHVVNGVLLPPAAAAANPPATGMTAPDDSMEDEGMTETDPGTNGQ